MICRGASDGGRSIATSALPTVRFVDVEISSNKGGPCFGDPNQPLEDLPPTLCPSLHGNYEVTRRSDHAVGPPAHKFKDTRQQPLSRADSCRSAVLSSSLGWRMGTVDAPNVRPGAIVT